MSRQTAMKSTVYSLAAVGGQLLEPSSQQEISTQSSSGSEAEAGGASTNPLSHTTWSNILHHVSTQSPNSQLLICILMQLKN